MANIERIGKLVVCSWEFIHQGKQYKIPVYLDIIGAERNGNGQVISVTVNAVYQPYEYLNNLPSAFEEIHLEGSRIPIEVMGVINNENLFR